MNESTRCFLWGVCIGMAYVLVYAAPGKSDG
jgi:hypothetical protein